MLKIVFCQRIVYSLFGFMTISAVLKEDGHETDLVMQADPQKAAQEILELAPDVVMFSALTATGDIEWTLQIADRIKRKRPGILVVVGGTQATLFPAKTMAHASIDVACQGEGEPAMRELCRKLAAGADYSRIRSLWVRTPQGVVENPMGNLVENLDDLPFPDRGMYAKSGYFDRLDSLDVIAGRGCTFNCSYCMNTTLKEMMRGKGQFIRKHSPQYMIDQLKELQERYHPKSFTFVDELFTVNKTWLREFCGLYKENITVPFICSVTADTVDEETAELLAEAGVFRVCLGLETGNEDLRHKVLNKRFTNEQFFQTADRLHRHGIRFLTSNMLGLPGETVDNAFETVRLNREAKTDYLYYSVFQPYPELVLTNQMKKDGLLDDPDPAGYDSTFFKGSLLKQDNIRELVNLHKFFYLAVKFPWMEPLIRRLIRLPPNWFFEQVFIVCFGWMQFRCFKRNPVQLLAMGIGNLKVYYSRSKESTPSPCGSAAKGNKEKEGKCSCAT
ncbi:MAG: B12-binding domain-containing radical SAM protein [Candidatus Omnitrophica bacterium]|nr:B12-binding domain-containing radical SAM protein [Candidatus Omnitrophota bacterium]MCB9721884.1 B12-binding domain-containing radical SAM protein [Candidatus Omnitrophota bacterium]